MEQIITKHKHRHKVFQALPMCNAHPYFSLKNLGNKVHITHKAKPSSSSLLAVVSIPPSSVFFSLLHSSSVTPLPFKFKTKLKYVFFHPCYVNVTHIYYVPTTYQILGRMRSLVRRTWSLPSGDFQCSARGSL